MKHVSLRGIKPALRWGALLVVLAAGALGWRFLWKPDDTRLNLITTLVSRRDITATVNASGTLDPIVKVLVSSQVSGRIQTLSATYNDRVKKNQVLAQIEPSSFKAKVEQAEALVAKEQATVMDAQRTFRRIQDLSAEKIGSQSDLDSARTKLELAQADLRESHASLNQARVDFANTRILSPIDGVVISRNVEEGQTVAASLSAPTLFTIADDLAKLQIVANVDEADVGQVAEGQEVSFTVDAFPQSSFQGIVQLIRNSPVNVQGVITYETIIHVENPEQRLRPGMTANVTIVVARKKHALALPNLALRFRPPEGFSQKRPEGEESAPVDKKKGKRVKSHVTVWCVKDGVPTPERVKIGITDGAYTEVRDGLAEKVVVVVGVQPTEASGPKAAPPEGRSPVR